MAGAWRYPHGSGFHLEFVVAMDTESLLDALRARPLRFALNYSELCYFIPILCLWHRLQGYAVDQG